MAIWKELVSCLIKATISKKPRFNMLLGSITLKWYGLKVRLMQIAPPIQDGLAWRGSGLMHHTIPRQAVLKRLQSDCARQFAPYYGLAWGVASWGVAVQMKYIKDVERVWGFFRLTMDPVSFVTKRNECCDILVSNRIGLDSCAPCRGVV